ncbi:MAG: hypothetical protein Ct9H300mP25_17400 [Acidobacteriota bacterium]|jgi:hypothetical protein|nr:MAG: hypothetical protein Ct9H300mP25_17400 [Acidobacteriota bacterium]
MGVMRVFSSTVIFVAVAVAVGCSGPEGATIDSDGSETVSLSVEHRSEWRQLWIQGATDLPDGAFLNYSVTHELAESSPPDQWPATNLLESGRATVKDGQFWSTINTLNWPNGNVRVLVQFPFPPQPPPIESRYGPMGEHLTGENVTTLAGMKAVEVEHQFEHRR